MLYFNMAPVVGTEINFINEAINSRKFCGDGVFTKRCQSWFEERFSAHKTLLTPSCTHALEMAAILIDIKPGDEVIMPSYTFVSTANAFVLRGAKVIFVDIRQDTMNIDETKIEAAITSKTRAIVPVHYAGISCEMDAIMSIANKYELYVIEDAAQGVMSEYKGKALGTIGHFGTYSFHETKNYTSAGEGGLLLVNDKKFVKRADVIREKGTNRSQFLRGQVDKYSWVDLGSSYLMSDISAAYLYAQMLNADTINNDRLTSWDTYFNKLEPLAKEKYIDLPTVPEHCVHNAHMFYIKVADLSIRSSLIKFLKEREVQTAFHYVPLHSSLAGETYSDFHGTDAYTTVESERLVRLPLWYGLDSSLVDDVCSLIIEFFKK